MLAQVVEEVLEETGYKERRTTELAIDDFLCLLAAFNKRDIHFS